jgi:hypothetical protein
MDDYAYEKIWEQVMNDFENYGFDTQEEAQDWLFQHLIG